MALTIKKCHVLTVVLNMDNVNTSNDLFRNNLQTWYGRSGAELGSELDNLNYLSGINAIRTYPAGFVLHVNYDQHRNMNDANINNTLREIISHPREHWSFSIDNRQEVSRESPQIRVVATSLMANAGNQPILQYQANNNNILDNITIQPPVPRQREQVSIQREQLEGSISISELDRDNDICCITHENLEELGENAVVLGKTLYSLPDLVRWVNQTGRLPVESSVEREPGSTMQQYLNDNLKKVVSS